ncbi:MULTISPECIES: SusC/RagA family TonB-linked outer membrane protein [unclassified Butyricimonas]|uniref:SusC/RagA family TonB-linked outer membrane protein n=1 Tax=unclassified Butyricimonas TaxID=2637652 RepID=UPI000C06F75F|nr:MULTISPECIES: SusC/RagA family TonB-linked outer membrane protein [unclassified Butyricimonas]
MEKKCDLGINPPRWLKKFLLVMRITGILCLVCVMHLSAAVYSQTARINLKMKDATIEQVLNRISESTKMDFFYSNSKIDVAKKVNVDFFDATLEEALRAIFKGCDVKFEIADDFVIIHDVRAKVAVAVDTLKNTICSGKVTDKENNPLPGVTVILKGTSIGTTTDVKGCFEFPIPQTKNPVLIFTFIGMKSTEKAVKVGEILHVQLEEENTELEEVVSYGYYNVDKRLLTSSVTSLKASDIMMPGVSTIDQMLEGHVPGMIFMQNSGQVGASPKIKIRGTTTILGKQAPLWVLDGIILSDPVNVDASQLNDLDFVNLLGNAISGLNPEDVEQIDVLKDASATAIYGPRASNGVIVITTKKGKIGKPSVSYSLSGTFRRRPRYSDRAVNVMNSQERIAYSREAIESKLPIPNISTWIGYEAAYYDYSKGILNHDEFTRQVRRMETVNTDWLGLLMNDTYSNSHTLSLSGGTNNMRYYASLGYSDEQGNIKNEENKRYSGMVKLDLNYNKFIARFGLSGSLSKRNYTPEVIGVTNYAYNSSRSVPAYNEDGSLFFYQREVSDLFDHSYNILNEMKHSDQTISTNLLGLSVALAYKFFPALKAEVTFGYNISDTDQETYFGEKSWHIMSMKGILKETGQQSEYASCPSGGELSLSNTNNEGWTTRFSLSYNKMLDHEESHLLNATMIGEISSVRYHGFSITKRGYLPDRGLSFDIIEPGKFKEYDKWLLTDEARGIMTDNLTRLVGLVGSINYSYKNEFILNANARIDGSNKFGDRSNKKLNPIWSVSGRWNFEEKLLYHVHWVNRLALRASFGYQGNMSAQESPRLIIKKMGTDRYFKEFYSTIKNYPNPNLKWEKTSNLNVGLDFSLFNEKLHGSIEYYYRYTKDAFLAKQVSVVNGVESYLVNGGNIKNQGVEFYFNFVPINNLNAGGSRKGFVWKIDPNFGSVFNQLVDKIKPKNKVLQDEITYRDYLDGKVQVVGRPVNTFYSYRFKGLNPENGAPMFYNTDRVTMVDGEEVETATIYQDMDKEEVFTTVLAHSGCREPFLQGGVYNYLGYGNWGLSFNLSYSIGSKIRLFRLYPNDGQIVSPEKNLRKELSNRWKRPGDENITNIPGILSGLDQFYATNLWCNDKPYVFASNIWQMYDESNIRVVSGNYLKLSSISLRYVIPESLCKKVYMRSAYLSFSGTNVFTLCSKKLKGQDPSQSGTTDLINISVRPTYSLQLNVTF